MRIRLLLRVAGFGLVLLAFISVVSAVAATNNVPSSRLSDVHLLVGANDLKPAACASLDLTNVVSGAGTITGTSGNDLILGSSGADTIDGGGGDDCILGGAGDDTIDGNTGTDICIGGAGTDTFNNCETTVQ